MLEKKLLYYLKALDLEPLWINKNQQVNFSRGDFSQTSHTTPIKNAKNITQSYIESIPKISTSRVQSTEHTPETSSFDNKSQLANRSIATKKNTNIIIKKQEIYDLEMNIRTQLILTQWQEKTILIGFLNSSLSEKQHPLENTSYAWLLKNLFELLKLSPTDLELFNLKSLEKKISDFSIHACILFSKTFQYSNLFHTLRKKNTPVIILEHPYTLLRNPILKKEVWFQLQQFFKALS